MFNVGMFYLIDTDQQSMQMNSRNHGIYSPTKLQRAANTHQSSVIIRGLWRAGLFTWSRYSMNN